MQGANEQRSEVARLLSQISAEYEAARLGLTGLAYGVSQHEFVALFNDATTLREFSRHGRLVCGLLELRTNARDRGAPDNTRAAWSRRPWTW